MIHYHVEYVGIVVSIDHPFPMDRKSNCSIDHLVGTDSDMQHGLY